MLEAARPKSGSTTTEHGPRRASRSVPTLVWEPSTRDDDGGAADSVMGERFRRVWYPNDDYQATKRTDSPGKRLEAVQERTWWESF